MIQAISAGQEASVLWCVATILIWSWWCEGVVEATPCISDRELLRYGPQTHEKET